MNPKKLCSIGILDIELNLILYQSQVEKYNFNINKYNKVQDLKNLFYGNNNNENNLDYFNYVSLSSENNLINTLLFINRSYKSKTFIEFIMPNRLDFSENTKFVRNLLTDVFNKNYLFIIENRIMDVPSKIKFNIKIIDDETKEIIQMKIFELFEMNDIEIDLNNNKENTDSEISHEKYNNKNNRRHTIKIEYNFDEIDYFLIDLLTFKEFIWKNKFDMINFIYNIINKNKNIIIILIINDKCFKGIEFTSLLDVYKEIIELSDILFCNKNEMNYFFKTYNELKNRDDDKYDKIKKSLTNNNLFPRIYKNKNIPHTLLNINELDLDLILLDEDKHRKNFPRISVLFEDFESSTIYRQSGAHMDVDYSQIFYFKLKNKKLDINSENKDMNEKYVYFFIGGFLSRLINNKSFRVCFFAVFLLIQKIMKNIVKKNYLFNIDDYNVLVPNEKKSLKEKIIEYNMKMFEEKESKEKGFVLDCTNVIGCKIKNYNPLMDNNCASYLLNKNNIEHLQKHGFINKNGIILKDPGTNQKPKSYGKQRKKLLLPIVNQLNNAKNDKNNYNKKLLNTLQISNGNTKEIKRNKYSKTINNFYRIKNKKNSFLEYQNNKKNNLKIKKILMRKNNKKEENSTLMSRTIKNNNLYIQNINKSAIKTIKVKNRAIEHGPHISKNKYDKDNKTKLPKYKKYSKYLFQLYRPDIKYSEFIENQEAKKRNIKRTYSQI